MPALEAALQLLGPVEGDDAVEGVPGILPLQAVGGEDLLVCHLEDRI